MRNVIIYAPVRSGRSWVARRVKEELGHKGNIIVADEFYEGEKPELYNGHLIVCMGFAEISPQEEVKLFDNKDTLEFCAKRIEESKKIKTQAEKLGLKYFDVSFCRGHFDNKNTGFDEIVGYIKSKL